MTRNTLKAIRHFRHGRSRFTDVHGCGGLRLSLLAMGVAMAAAGAQAQDETLEEITVTGSRIRATSGFETPTPVTSISTEELQDFEPGNTVSQQLNALPQFFGNRTSQQTSDGSRFSPAGNTYSFLNLRNLGGNRTLVLLDGHRLQPSDKDGTVNADLLPSALVRSVDVVTGGASAAYGADAVGGVVNFILDREFEGLTMNVGTGVHETGVGRQWRLGMAGGRAFFDDRLNVIASFDALEIDQIRGDRRAVDNFRRWGWVKNPQWTPGSNVPQRLTLPDVVSTHSSPTGLIVAPGTPLDRTEFSIDGTYIQPFVTGDVVSWPGERGGTSSMAGGPPAARAYDTFDNSPSSSEVVSRSWFLGLQYQVTDRLTLTTDARGGRTEANQDFIRGGFELETPWDIRIAQDNAFLPEQVRQLMIDNDMQELRISKLGSYVDRPEIGSNTVTENVLTQWQLSGGFDYSIPGVEWNLTGHYQTGESRRKPEGMNAIRMDRVYLGIDAVRDPATGAIVCRVQLFNPSVEQLRAAVEGRISSVPLDPREPPGVAGNTKPLEAPIGLDNTIRDCIPYNVMGSGNISRAALDYVSSPKTGDGTVEQDFAELLLTGELYEGWGAGPLSFAAGLTWRDQEFIDLAETSIGTGVGGKIVTMEDLGPPINVPSLGIRGISPGIQNGSANLHLFSTVPNIAGDASVWEWFGELQMPLWESASGGQRLDLNLAYRQSDYERSGTADSWKAGLDVQLHEDVRLRFTRSRDVREPTFEELFDAQGGGSSVEDPLFDRASVQTNTLSGGNRNLAPEIGNTWTAGIVWQPSFADWLDGLQIAVDYYDIEITDRVDELSAQRILDECELNGILCERITRDPATGQLVNVFESYVNLGEAAVSGTDLEVLWNFEPDFFPGQLESFNLRWLGAFLEESSTTPFGGTPRDVAGSLGTPEYTQVFTVAYGLGPWSVQLQNRYVDSTLLNDRWVEGVDVDDNTISSMNWWNARFGFNGELNNGASWGVNLNVQNILDREPPVVPGFGTRGGTQQFHSSFDIFGRRYNLSANYNF